MKRLEEYAGVYQQVVATQAREEIIEYLRVNSLNTILYAINRDNLSISCDRKLILISTG